MNKKYDVITALDITADLIANMGNQIPEFGQKEKFLPDYGIEMGGSTCIFACQAAKLGLKAAGIGVAGDDVFGRLVVEKLKGSGVVTDHIRVDEGIKTGISVHVCVDNDRTILTYLGTIDAVCAEDFTDSLLESSRHMHIGSYYLMKRLQPFYNDIVKRAKGYGMTISLDTNWDPDENWDGGIWDVLHYVDIFLPNENEAMAITGKKSPQAAAETLTGIVPVVALKKGKEGAAAYGGGREYFCEPLEVEVVDAVGAGDSFDAGFVYGFLKGYEIEKCLRIGCICGSMNTTRAGGIAGQIRIEELMKII